MLEVRGLRKSYRHVEALRGVDLTVPAGSIVSLLGPNGAGKTTLVSIVSGLRTPDAGSVHIDGVDALTRRAEARRLVGLAPQDLGIYPIVRVRDNLVLFGQLAGLGRRELEARIDEVAGALGIAELLPRVAGELSGGQKRRLHTAIALLHRPRLLLLDEATVGADVETRHQLLGLVRSMADDGAAVLYSTHYLHEVEELGASVAILDDGELIAQGPYDELVAAHATPTIELRFEGAVPDPPRGESGTVDGQVMRVEVVRPGDDLARILWALGDAAGRVTGVEVVGSSLESVYLSLTGRRYRAAGKEREGARVMAG
ncbi:MAG: ABC transporter ATP-binding protein [Actinobacteria bacterium]|nr:ABC transporter ATP-binding protein [Actinomycetota bacterium]